MRQFVLVFDRRRGELLQEEEFADSQEALRSRFDLEGRYRDSPDIEVVVLGAQSRDALRRTHGRYYKTVANILREADATNRPEALHA